MANNDFIARPYAEAAFEFALDHSDVECWQSFFELVANIASYESVINLIANPNITKNEILEFFFDLSEKAKLLNEARKNFLKILAAFNRLNILFAIKEQFEKLLQEHEKVLIVKVISAYELTAEQKNKLSEKLKKRTNKSIKLLSEIDATLLGGAIIYAGDMVIDGSGRNKIEKMRNCLEE